MQRRVVPLVSEDMQTAGGAMLDGQTSTPLPPKRPRSGPDTWPRHYCDPAISPKHAKGQPSPRTSPKRAPRSEVLALAVVIEVAAILGSYPRHHEPPNVVADLLLRVLPMSDRARSTIALVVHRNGTGTCDDLTYRQASELTSCTRHAAIDHFGQTEGYGFIHMEKREHAYGGAAPNLITAKIPEWVYAQVDDYHALPSSRRPDETASAAQVRAEGGASAAQPGATAVGPALPTEVGAAPGMAAAGEVAAAVASPSPSAADGPPVSNTTAATSDVLPTTAAPERAPPPPALSPEDAAIDARLEEIHAFTGYRFQVATIRGLNLKVPERRPQTGVPALDDEQILAALDEYIKNEKPKIERKAKYGERLPTRAWVQNGIHVFLGYKRLRLNERTAERPAHAERTRRGAAARRPTQARSLASLTAAAAAAPVQFGAAFDFDTTIVRSVSPGSIAARLALQAGDKVVRVDDQAIGGPDELRVVLATMAPGPHRFELVRSNEVVTATVTLEPRGPPST